MFVALLLLSGLALVQGGLHRFGRRHGKNSPYHPLEHNSRYQSDDDDQKTGDSIHHLEVNGFRKDYQYYNSWDESEIEPKRNEALFVARTLQTQTKKYIKNRLHKGSWSDKPNWKAYCEGPTAARCVLFLCDATKDLVTNDQFAKHLSHKKICPEKGNYPALAASPQQKKATGLNKQFRRIEPHSLVHYMRDQYTKAKKLCHKTKHTTDDRCKAEVLCLTLEIFPATWPNVFNELSGCAKADIMKRDPHSPKLKHIKKSDYEDFARLAGKWHKPIPLRPWDANSATHNHDHHRNFKDQVGQRHYSEKASGRSERGVGRNHHPRGSEHPHDFAGKK